MSVEPSPRLQRIRAALLDAPYHLCTQKAELLTTFLRAHRPHDAVTEALAARHFDAMKAAMKRNLGEGAQAPELVLRASNALQAVYEALDATTHPEPLIVSLARGFAHVLGHMQLRVYPDELIMGNPTAHRIGSAIHPEYGGMLMLPELDQLTRRELNPLAATDEQLRRLEDDILPWWFTCSILSRAPLLAADKLLQNRLVEARDFVLTQFAGIAHVVPDYPTVLRLGLRGVLEELRAAQRHAQSSEQREFYEAATICVTAAMDFAQRQARFVAGAAEVAEDPERAAELRELAAVLARVPIEPARTYHEALQSVFTTHVVIHQESFQHGISFGRIDQYLAPFLDADLEAGRLDEARAVELTGCFLAKAAEQLPLFNAMSTEFFSGLSSASGLTLGGTDPRTGADATTSVTRAILLAYHQLRLRQPNLHLRVHPGTPEGLRRLAYAVLREGGGMPALFRDEGVVDAIRGLGVPHEAAEDYAIVGCVEWGVPYRSFPAAGAAFVSLPAILRDLLMEEHEPPLRDMDDVWAAFRAAVEARIEEVVAGNDAIERAHAEYRPTPMLSAVVRGCAARGKDVCAGGADFNSTGVQAVGVADVADSLTVLEQLVFPPPGGGRPELSRGRGIGPRGRALGRDGFHHRLLERTGTVKSSQSLSLGRLRRALARDFVDEEALRQRLRNHVPKYGQDAGPPERWARRVAELYAELLREHLNPRHGPYAPGFWSMTTHVGFGRRLGALPSGRKAGRPLANGLSPSSGADNRGPTASLLSVAAVSGGFVGNGYALNETLDPSFVRGEVGLARIDQLVRGYFAAGGNQVQFNVLDTAELVDAKAHPERHRGLVVRISGYSAYFNDLSEAMKDELIARSRHGASACPVVLAGEGGEDGEEGGGDGV
ncbi:pyruvate formate-lyase 2 (pflD) [Plesiocystis pacifica SIR-1]|uniref:Pyruvate formate-lyase 2 (PflD) n=1 Tax=Plesiocystis pacifica SIR-1 TaxID=391625 RepID=A6G8C6_9BACT|nr:pyruvate formate lyase family protein [Plesiocystis pacifica]EDM77836.1 pyruvate formate-lyase 2 (pflD) [Plesiocystis pacifica SIR-1]